MSSPSGVCIASAGERAIGAHLPARTLERVLRGKPARSVLDLVQQIECVVVLVPPRSGVGQEQDDVERSGVVFVDAQLVLAQAERLLAETRVGAFKLGVLGSPGNVAAVAGILSRYPEVPVVLDPVCERGEVNLQRQCAS